MAKTQSTFPTTIDSTLQVDRAPGDTITSESYDVIEDALFELETKVGVDGSAVATSIDYMLKNGLTANYKYFANAAGTAPEWAIGIKMGSFTRDMTLATGNVEYTGVGFKPAGILFFGSINGTAHEIIGGQVGAACGSMSIDLQYTSSAAAINMYVDAGNYQFATVNSFDADGFTLAWVKNNAPTGTATFNYIAFR